MRVTTSMPLATLAATWLAMTNIACAASENWRERASAEEVVTASDITAEVSFGREIAARILGKHKFYDNPPLIKYVSLVGLSLARNTNRPELEYHFMILDTLEVNAYAAPGGYVFITKGALQLMKDESELAGAIAHEIAHVTEKHVVKELKIKGTDDSAVSGLAQLVGGNSESARSAFAQVVEQGLEMIFKNEYKREDEMQADKSAVSITAMTGYNSIGLARYLDRLSAISEKFPEPKNDGTHPTFAARISQIKDVITKDGIDVGALATNKERFAAALQSLK
jgi:beta-barrel assembly-enhancing protease